MTTPDDEGSSATRPRITRPEPARTMPRRSWSNLFGAAADPGAAPGSPNDGTGESDAPAASETVSRAVELGYRVIDEYIRQGQKAAQRLSSRSWSPETALRDTQDLTARMTRHASDLVGLWVDMLDSTNLTGAWRTTTQPWSDALRAATDAPASTNGASEPGVPDHGQESPAAASPGRTRIAIEIASEKPAEVSVDLRSEDTTRRLVVHSLRAVEPEKPRITDVVIESATPQTPPRLRIRVPTGQPPGTYNALVIDEETSRPVGSVSLRISS